MADPFLLRMSPAEAQAFIAACERAASGEQERRQEQQRATAAAERKRQATDEAKAAMSDPSCFSFIGRPAAGWEAPMIDDGVEYDRPLPPRPGSVNRRIELGWRRT